MGRDEGVIDSTGLMLDIGAGMRRIEGWFSIDDLPYPGLDLVHDLAVTPWPLGAGCAVRAMAHHSICRVERAQYGLLRFMNEVHRLLQPGGEFLIVAPYGLSPAFLQEPTFCTPVVESTFYCFDPEHASGLWQRYQPQPWRIVRLEWDPATILEVTLARR